MRSSVLLCLTIAAGLGVKSGALASAPQTQPSAPDQTPGVAATTEGSVTVSGLAIPYRAVAGTLVVHAKNWDDAIKAFPADDLPKDKDRDEDSKSAAAASMFYVAYFKRDADQKRPLTFLFNGGPGSSTVWLHMGSFGPKRVLTRDAKHTPGAPYRVVDNDESLLDASDLVFVDAPGTGFGRLAGKDADKEFWGVDEDGHAFADFIIAFLSRYGRWNSPKYLFGESYGTTRSAVIANILESEDSIDLNGIILLSQAFSFDLSPDIPANNPGNDLPYVLALPSYAAAAWYHHRLDGNYPELPSFLHEVEQFSTNDYMLALAAGATLDPSRRVAIAAKLHDYTGLQVDYILRADLRIDSGEFEQHLLDSADDTTGRLDTRFSGPTLDPLAKEANYDPQSSAISSAYVSAFNDYVRKSLKYGGTQVYKSEIDPKDWNYTHEPPGAGSKLSQAVNVMPDLAAAMIYNPDLHVQLNQGYFDLATPYFVGEYEMRHLPMPRRLQANIEYRRYQSGHMVYIHDDALKALHDNVADFITRTAGK